MRAPVTDLPIMCDSVSVSIGDTAILENVSLLLAAGPPTVLIGPNGAGKTTLLRLVMGLIAPTRGRVTWGGREAGPPTRRAIMFQRPVMLRRSVAGNLTYALAAAGCPRRERPARAAALLDLVGLAHLGERPARRLSGGEQQKLALARTLAREPEVLFLDEPTTSLDPAATKAIEDIVRAVAARGIKVAMSTHDLGQARRLAGDIVLMHRGRIVEQAKADTFFDTPRTPEAVTFIAGIYSSRNNRRTSMPTRRHLIAAALALACLAPAPLAQAQDKSIVVASTTSTQDSGLFGHILPLFKARTGIDVKVIAQGTGQALDTGRRGDADVVFVHAKAAEEKFIGEGARVKRFHVMYNDFVLIGPAADPAGIKGGKDIVAALKAIKDKAAPFVSRGDRSGTHQAELALWRVAGVDVAKDKGPWYREIGQGMGAALNTAQAMGAYVLADRGTWISFKNRGDLAIGVEGDKRLFNQYGVILVNPEKHPHVKKELGQAFIDWLVSADGQKAIADYKIEGQQLFFPNASVPGA